MLEALLQGRGDIVYGSRYMRSGRHANQSWAAYLGGRSLSIVARIFTGAWIYRHRDRAQAVPATGDQGTRADDERVRARSRNHRQAAGARATASSRCRSRYNPRSKEEGKKIGLRDWFIGTRTFFRFRNG